MPDSPPPDDERLLEIQVETLFRLDAGGRLRTVNEPGEPVAPRLFLGRTRRRAIVRYRHDVEAETVRALDRLLAREPLPAHPSGERPPGWDEAVALLREQGEIRGEWAGPAFRFPAILEERLPSVGLPVREIVPENAALLGDAFAPLIPLLPDIWPCVAVVSGGGAVAVCHAARRSALAAEAGVVTLPEFRGRGCGLAAVDAWARIVVRADLLPLYSTSWDNDASRGLDARLGLIVYAEDRHVT